jgi:peptidyl-prolyl cis-trans isomerase A (cyclophilin A)
MRLAVLVAALAVSPPAALLHPAKLHAKAPNVYAVAFKTTKGTFTVTVHRAWAPRGADRFYNLVVHHFYDGQRLFRVVPGFVVQFGISGTPAVAKAWQHANIKDDPVTHPNAAGTISFADAGPNTRSTQVFVNTGANQRLDSYGFAPFGAVTSGMKVVRSLYSGYADAPTSHQAEMVEQGNAYFAKHWPKLDSIVSARIVERP